MEIIERLEKVLQTVFEDKNMKITRATSSNDIPGWDSMMHMIVISEIEEEFNLSFTFKEVSNFNAIDDIANCIEKKLQVI